MAYSPCIAHGYDLADGPAQQKLAVDSGHWPLYRFDPRLRAQGKNPLQLDSGAPKIDLKEYVYNETRYRMLQAMDPERAKGLLDCAQAGVKSQWSLYEQLSKIKTD
jgi:pyruvate-ferredoxin/flavodoxin oxidoreductase